MATRIRILQVAIAVVNLVIAALLVTSVWPFPSGNFKVDLPSPNEISWTYAGGLVHVVAPYTIDNGGFYDVDDLTIRYRVLNWSSYEITAATISMGTVPAGRVTTSSLDFTFDLLRLYRDGATWMVFNDDLLRFYVEVSCLYTSRLIKFEASYQVSVFWEALIQSWGVSGVRYPSSYPGPPAPFSVSIDYWLETSNLLAPLSPAQVTVVYFGNETELGRAQTTVMLGGNNSGTVSLDLTLGYYTSYSVELRILVADFVISERYEAPPPPGVSL